jgi:hypothetical protein
MLEKLKKYDEELFAEVSINMIMNTGDTIDGGMLL